MRFKHLFHPKTKASGSPAPELSGRCGANAPLAKTGDLQEAWAELTEAAQGSKVMSFHAYTRTGTPWAQDPAAVRAVAAILREFPADGQHTT
ncbi:hypothetical protein [Arthrobacter globiformis]|uniref:hypothetical protein n=1 Tax=Arthrobacter globiformis TaxID=1665 RepID=UPI00278D6779|nr:hypothetical protein [Arthrobacter globiformis]MDQ0619205.1 hypothetical protein [Arthrobacter globiformis]